jgi:DNA polymerase-3 subunit epsilon
MTTGAAVVVTDRSTAIAWAASCCTDANVVYLDTETTGLDGGAEIIDLAVIDHIGRPLLDTLVRPKRRIPADATAIHGIDDGIVAGAPGWPDVYPQLAALLAHASQVVVYNSDFDARIITQVSLAAGLPPLGAPWTCAMQGYAAFAGQRHERYGGWRWHKLIIAAERFAYPLSQRHRALDDARMCRAVVLGMATGAALDRTSSTPERRA